MKLLRWSKTVLIIIVFMLLFTAISWGNVRINNGDYVSFFRDITVNSNTNLRGDVVSLFGNVRIDGEVQGDVVAILGRIEVNNRISGDVVSVFGGVNITSNGMVEGDTVSVLGSGINNKGAVLGSEISVLGFVPSGMPPLIIVITLIVLGLLIQNAFAYAMSVVAIILFGDKMTKMADEVFIDGGKKAVIGLLAYVGAFVGGVVLIMTMLGIPLLALLVPAILLLGFLGNTVSKLAIGRKIKNRYNKDWGIMMELLLGSLVYTLLDIIIVGKLVTFILRIIGMGEIIESRFGEKINKTLN